MLLAIAVECDQYCSWCCSPYRGIFVYQPAKHVSICKRMAGWSLIH
ncbi:hypothetical protein YPPY34_2111 [Yersinia pestis PY-34]|nr:hypothetical protein YPPY34_2111 [Yersinia pestis PY-34]EIS79544.1 hypothetical protein YPPY72_2223 [Yersinia pestis PY-72]